MLLPVRFVIFLKFLEIFSFAVDFGVEFLQIWSEILQNVKIEMKSN